jgi:predicted transcriptional regulator
MRVRTNIIIEESILAKIDAIAVEKPKRAAVIEKALLEFIAREEAKEAANPKPETLGEKAVSKTKKARV